MSRNITFNVAPRYTAGSPAAVDYRTAIRVVSQERDSYEHAKGTPEDKGLELIVFEMDETSKGWNVHDMITDRQWFWPFEARCAGCKHRTSLKRGVLRAHVQGNPEHNPCAADVFMGKELKNEARFRSYHGSVR